MILINPPLDTKYPQPPLGLASLAAVLERNGYNVEILDANALQLSEKDVVKKAWSEDIIGITAMTPTINSAIRIARGIKQNNPESTIIFGGPHATILAEDILNNVPEIDIIVRGEGEETIVELCNALENNNSIENICGISYRDDNAIKNTPSRPHIMDLDSLPFLAYHLLPLGKYKLHPPHGREYPFMAMLTSRGCPFKCIFCSKSVFGSTYRGQSPERIVDEIVYLKERFGIKEIAFYDDVLTLKQKRVMRLVKEFEERNLDIPWTCEARVNLVTEELLRAMKKAGCYMIAYGIESGNQMILNNLRKNITIEQIKSAIVATYKAGIQSVGYFMFGSPGETPETIRQTIDFARSLELDFAQFSVTIPFPGTDLYDLYLDSGNKNTKWDDFIYASLKSSSAPVFETESLSKEDLREWNSKAYKEFYFRLSYIWRRFIGMRSIGDLKTNIKGFLMFLDMVAH
ncbi:Ribosomal protein S12 methylthiotransferase RimO [ANME-1 cluster archaeon GoMg1]|nr:Ribosomal protein S12 methylthiotransferase RimO [ANME-1 cluster archaeon GoMg1]